MVAIWILDHSQEEGRDGHWSGRAWLGNCAKTSPGNAFITRSMALSISIDSLHHVNVNPRRGVWVDCSMHYDTGSG